MPNSLITHIFKYAYSICDKTNKPASRCTALLHDYYFVYLVMLEKDITVNDDTFQKSPTCEKGLQY